MSSQRNQSSETPQINLPDIFLESQEILDKVQQKIAEMTKTFSFYNNVVIGIFLLGFLVLLFTLATVIFQAWEFNQSFMAQSKQIRIQEELIKTNVEQQQVLIESNKRIEERLDRIEKALSEQ